MVVLESNDVVGNALTARALGVLSCISHQSLEFQYWIIKALDKTKPEELNAAIYAAIQISLHNGEFALKIYRWVISKLQTDGHLKSSIKGLYKVFRYIDSLTGASSVRDG